MRAVRKDFYLQAPPPEFAVLDVGCLKPVVKVGEAVTPGQLVAAGAGSDLADMHSPVHGVVEAADAKTVVLRVTEPSGEPAPEAAPQAVSAAPLEGAGSALRERIARLGKVLPGPQRAALLIVNALEPEPGIVLHTPLLAHARPTLERGLDLARRVYGATRTVLAAPSGSSASLAGAVSQSVPPRYPQSLNPLVAARITGKEDPTDTAVLDLNTLWELGRLAETGQPLTKTLVSVGPDLYLCDVGLRLGTLARLAGIKVKTGDRVVVGGSMRGEAAKNLEQGLPKSAVSVVVIPHEAFPPVSDAPCVGCGECVLRCPVRIDPGMLSRYAEFGFFQKAAENHVNVCIECGVCGFFCISRRPLLQYIRLAKRELAACAVLEPLQPGAALETPPAEEVK